jgi:hypothetical protein
LLGASRQLSLKLRKLTDEGRKGFSGGLSDFIPYVKNVVAQILSRNQLWMEQQQKEQASTVVAQEVRVVPVANTPKHPAEANGPKHTVSGTIRKVTCEYPAALEFEVEAAAKTYRVYNNDFSKIDLSALGFTPETMNPCHDLEGYKAKVQYAESADSAVDGQVYSIVLHK